MFNTQPTYHNEVFDCPRKFEPYFLFIRRDIVDFDEDRPHNCGSTVLVHSITSLNTRCKLEGYLEFAV